MAPTLFFNGHWANISVRAETFISSDLNHNLLLVPKILVVILPCINTLSQLHKFLLHLLLIYFYSNHLNITRSNFASN